MKLRRNKKQKKVNPEETKVPELGTEDELNNPDEETKDAFKQVTEIGKRFFPGQYSGSIALKKIFLDEKKKPDGTYGPVASAIRKIVLTEEYGGREEPETTGSATTEKGKEDKAQIPGSCCTSIIDNLSYIPSLDQTENGIIREEDDLYISGTFFSPFSSFFFRYLNLVLARGENVVFICNSEEEMKNVTEYLKKYFVHITGLKYLDNDKIKSLSDIPLWGIETVCGRNKFESDGDLDEKSILVTMPDYVCSDEFERYKQFIRRIDMVVLVDAVRTVNDYSIQLAAMNIKFETIAEISSRLAKNSNTSDNFSVRYRYQPIRYVCFDNYIKASGLRQRLTNILGRKKFIEADCGMISDKTNIDFYRYEETGDRVRLLTNTDHLSVPIEFAIRSSAFSDQVNIFAAGYPHLNMKSTVNEHAGELVEYQLKNIYYDGFAGASGKINEYGVIVASDEVCNLPYTVRKFACIAEKKKSLISVVSKPYLLRDFFYSYISSCWLDLQVMKIPASDAETKAAALRLLIKASSGGISEDEALRIAKNDNFFSSYFNEKIMNGQRVIMTDLQILKLVPERMRKEKRDADNLLARIRSNPELEDENRLREELVNYPALRAFISDYRKTVEKDKDWDIKEVMLCALEICGLPVSNRSFYEYFSFIAEREFDENGNYTKPINCVKLIENGELCDLLEGHNLARLRFQNSDEIVKLPIRKERISQNYLVGQNILYSGCLYEINSIDLVQGVINVKAEEVGANRDVYQYNQYRKYHVDISRATMIRSFEVPLEYDQSGKNYSRFYVNRFQAPIMVETEGYYEYSPFSGRVETLDSVFRNNVAVGGFRKLSDKQKYSVCRVYGDYNPGAEMTKQIMDNGGFFYPENVNVLSFALDTSFSKDVRNKVAYQLGVMMNELLRSIFPYAYDSVVVLPVLSKDWSSVPEISRDMQAVGGMQPILSEESNTVTSAEKDNNSDGGRIELLVVEDYRYDLGIVTALMSADGNPLSDFFSLIESYLTWLLSGKGDEAYPSDYLRYGLDHDLSCFDHEDVLFVASKLGNSANYKFKVEEKEIPKEECCCFCCKKKIKEKDKIEYRNNRYICLDCLEKAVGNNQEKLDKIVKDARKFIKKNYGVDVPGSADDLIEETPKPVPVPTPDPIVHDPEIPDPEEIDPNTDDESGEGTSGNTEKNAPDDLTDDTSSQKKVPDYFYPIVFESIEMIDKGLRNRNNLRSDPDSPVRMYVERDGSQLIGHVEYDIPPVNMEEAVIKQLIYMWLCKNMESEDFDDLGRAISVYCGIQYLQSVNEREMISARMTAYRTQQDPSSAGRSYLRLIEDMKEKGFYSPYYDNVFEYLMSITDLEEDPEELIPEQETEEQKQLLRVSKEFWKDLLKESERPLYERFLHATEAMDESIDVTNENLPLEDLKRIYESMIEDHPELFYLSEAYGWSYIPPENKVTAINPKYNYSKATVAKIRPKIIAAIPEFKKGVEDSMTDYQKTLIIHDNLVKLVDYDGIGLDQEHSGDTSKRQGDEMRTLVGGMLYHRCVCAGYARIMQYLLQSCNVVCTAISGRVLDGGGHEWNLVVLDGQLYHFDATWNDRSNNSAKTDYDDVICYNYFCVTTEEILKSRHLDMNPIPESEIPKAIGTEHNYFYQNKRVLMKYNIDQIVEWVEEDAKKPTKIIAFKCKDDSVMKKVRAQFPDGDNWKKDAHRIMDAVTAIRGQNIRFSVSFDEKINVVTFYVISK